MNRIQFQAGLSMKEFFDQYGTELRCETALVASRRQNGWSCPRCQDTRYTRTYNGRRLWECLKSVLPVSVLVGHRNHVREIEVAADRLVFGDLPDDAEQERNQPRWS